MNKRDLIQAVAEGADLTKVKAQEAVEQVLIEVENALAGGEKVSLHGFGVFSVKGRKGRMGRNPQTGQQVEIPARKAVNFKPADRLKQQVNA